MEITEAHAREYLRRAVAAREDPAAFIEFVMRSELPPHERIRLAPHQLVILAFLMHPPHVAAGLICPVGHGKTSTTIGLALWEVVRNTDMRGAWLSKTRDIAQKPLKVMRQLLESEVRIQGVNPKAVRCADVVGSMWSDVKFDLRRSPGIKDPTFQAAGLETGITGSRLDRIVCDDLIDTLNCATPDLRKKTVTLIDEIIDRRIARNGRVVYVNTPFHQDDYINQVKLRKPTLEMDAYGEIRIYNADPDWYWEDLLVQVKPAVRSEGGGTMMTCRLRAHEPDARLVVSLWPEHMGVPELEAVRATMEHNPGAFSRSYRSDCYDDASAMCKKEFTEKCKRFACEDARRMNAPWMLREAASYQGSNPTITGIDLAISQASKADWTAMFTFEVRLSDGVCVILDVDYGHWDARTILDKATEKTTFFKSALAVENTGMQKFVEQIMQHENRYVAVEGIRTGADTKTAPETGVTEIFYEMSRGMWRIPNRDGVCSQRMAEFVKACHGYTPARHTNDLLMAAFVGRQLAYKWGLMGKRGPAQGGQQERPLPANVAPPAIGQLPEAPPPMKRSAFGRRH